MKTFADILTIYFLCAGIFTALLLVMGAVRWIREALGGEEIEP